MSSSQLRIRYFLINLRDFVLYQIVKKLTIGLLLTHCTFDFARELNTYA